MTRTAGTAAVYVRISSDRTGEGLGVERQETECRGLASRLGLSVSEVYTDNDLSATSGKVRPAFERLLNDAPPLLIVWHTDRLVRASRDLERVLDLGLTVHAVTAGHIDLSTPSGRAVARTVTAWATYEGEQRTLRQRAETRQRAAAGIPQWNVRPFGYESDGTLREPEAQAIRDAYRDILDGASAHAVCRDWQARFPERHWYPSTVRTVLAAARNAGIRTHNGTEVAKGQWVPVVDESTWRAYLAQSAAKGHKGTRARKYLLSGIGVCGRCGATLNASGLGYGTKPRMVYQCSKTPGHFTRNMKPVDDRVIGRSLWVLIRPGAKAVLTERERPDADALRSERATLEHRRDVTLPNALAEGVSGPQVASASRTVQARIDEINAALVDDRRAELFTRFWGVTMREFRTEARPVWDALPLHQRQGILQALWVEICPIPGRNASVSLEPSALTQAILSAPLDPITDPAQMAIADHIRAQMGVTKPVLSAGD